MALIGLYDSGVGGLSVVRAVHTLLPHHDLYYLADSAFCPYGPLPRERVCDRAYACTSCLVEKGAQAVVVACNTATSAAMEMLRSEFRIPFVGMEPGIKPAIAATRTGQVSVLATGGTLAGDRFASLIRRFAHNTNIQMIPCPDLVLQVESGDLTGPSTRTLLEGYVRRAKEQNVDTIVLGCSHFHFVKPLIAELVGPGVTIIDTAPAVARQVARVAVQADIKPGSGRVRCATTSDPSLVAPILIRLWGSEIPVELAPC